MIVLGLDIATVTGFAWYDTKAHVSAIRAGIIKAEGDDAERKAASLAIQMVRMFKRDGKPDFVSIEQPMRNIVQHRKVRQDMAGQVAEQTVNPNALQLSALAGAAVGIIEAYGIPWETIPSATWRAGFLGFGRRAGMDRAGWKRAAIERCRLLKIDVSRADAAEAVGIAFAGAGSQTAKMMARERAA